MLLHFTRRGAITAVDFTLWLIWFLFLPVILFAAGPLGDSAAPLLLALAAGTAGLLIAHLRLKGTLNEP